MSGCPHGIVIATGGRFHMPWAARALAAESVPVHAFAGLCRTRDLAGCASTRTPLRVNVVRKVAALGAPSRTALINHAADAALGRQIRRFALGTGNVSVLHVWSAYAMEAFAAFKRERPRTVRVLESGSFHVSADFALLGDSSPPTVQRRAWRERLLAEYDMADIIIVPSKAAADSFANYGLSGKVRVLRYGVDPSFHLKSLPPRRPRDVLFVGNLTSQKGADLIVALAGELNARGHDLTVIGRDPVRAGTPVTRRLASHENVDIRGPVDASRLRSFFAESKVLVLPSRQEGYGMVALEAMAAGCLPLVSRAAGVSEAVEEFDPTLVLPAPETDVTPETVTNYLAGILPRLTDGADLALAREQAQEFAKNTSWSTFAKNCLCIYRAELGC